MWTLLAATVNETKVFESATRMGCIDLFSAWLRRSKDKALMIQISQEEE